MRYLIRRHQLPPRPISSPPLLPAPLPASPCRPAGRLEARRHHTRYTHRLDCLPVSSISSVHPSSPLLAPVPTHAAAHHLIHLIGSSTTPHPMRRATSKAERRTGRAIGNRKVERHDIRYLLDSANAPPRPPYSPYEPHDAREPTRTRPRENAPSMSPTTPQTGNTG